VTDEAYLVVAEDDEPRRALLGLYVGATARFVGRLSPDPAPTEFKGVIVPSTITQVEVDDIVVVATVEVIKRAWNSGGEIGLAFAHVLTKDEHRLTVSSTGGKAMAALMGLNPGDVARFRGRFSRPLEVVPNVEVSEVALIVRSGRIEAWCEESPFVSTDGLSPNFCPRVVDGLELLKGVCAACNGSIETEDQIGMMIVRNCEPGMVCADCGALPRGELVEKLSIAQG
jgi:hypothetical protein